MENHEPRIVVIGGGTGSFTLLQALKRRSANITALVNMADDGGSTGLLRDEFGVLPPGDVRQCLVALSESSDALRDLFNYRYPAGSSWQGHSFGNLFLSTVEMMTKDFGEAVKTASEVLNIRGKVVPLTLANCTLALERDSRKITGQYAIETTAFDALEMPPELWLEPEAPLNPEARTAIEQAELIVIAPGNFYASLVPALLVDGVKDALAASPAKVAYVCNLVNKSNHTDGFMVHDYMRELERLLGKDSIDYVLYNTDRPTDELLERYALEGEYPVGVDKSVLEAAGYKSIGGHFLAHEGARPDKNDMFIRRSLIRHDAEAVSETLMRLELHE